jgi:hypothetical protein
MTANLMEALERRAAQFSMSWGASGAHAEIMAAFAAQEIAALASEPVAGTVRDALAGISPQAWEDLLDHVDTARGGFARKWRERLTKIRVAYAVDCAKSALSAPPAPAGREEIARILRAHFYTGEPGDTDAIKAATEALSSLSPQGDRTTASAPEPVAWRYKDNIDDEWRFNVEKSQDEWDHVEPLYATPPAPGAADRAAVIEECIQLASTIDDCSIPYLIERLQELALAPANTGETGR